MKQFLWGVLAAMCVASATFFLRYWRDSRDRLFIYFSLAFLVMALNWIGEALIAPHLELQQYVYMTRLLAYGLIIIGVIDKNHRTHRR
jgi:O-antigen/teichoic acid export membrane protein